MQLAVLDRAATTPAETVGETLRGVINHARDVEMLGFSRFFVAEHHGVPGIPGSQPAQLATAVAAHTTSIRVGTAGIMVPNHPPFIIAEQIGVLEALYPGRIDVGLGSSVGFTRPVRAALRQGEPRELKSRYGADLDELLAYLRGDGPVHARPANHAATPLFVLAGYRSATLAGERGLGIITGGPAATQVSALEAYRKAFKPSPWLQRPHAIASLNIAAADTAAAARDLLLPENYSKVLSQSTGEFSPLRPAHELDLDALTNQQRERLAEAQSFDVTGTIDGVAKQLAALERELGVDEFLVTGDIPDRAGRLHSEELLSTLL